MTIDLRAYVYCSLGPLVNGSLADDHLQETGLVRCRGSAVINGIITPDAGSVVEFGYAKGTRLARLPRRLRVLSSFADPYSGQTTVQLGCLLTYYQDVQQPDAAAMKAEQDSYGLSAVPLQYRTWVPAFISAQGIFEECLTKLGISSSGASLTNKFIRSKFKWDKPYVQIISDLLQSECQFGFMDCADVLQVRSLYNSAVTGPLYDEDAIVELESSGVGELPGQSVYVPFSTLRLKPPEQNAAERINWEYNRSISANTVIITHANGAQSYNTLETAEEWTNYQLIKVIDKTDKLFGLAVPEEKEVKASVRKKVFTSGARALGNYASIVLSYGGTFFSGLHVEDTSSFYYYDEQGNEYLSLEETLEDNAVLVGRSGIPLGFPDPVNPGSGAFVTLPGGQSMTRRVVRRSETAAEYQSVRTETYVHYIDTQEGQQSVSATAPFIEDVDQAQDAINSLVSSVYPLVLQSVTEEVRRTGRVTSQGRPSADERMKAWYAKVGKNSIENRTEEIANIAIAYGSGASTRFIKLTMPYSTDDFAVVTAGSPALTSSDARQKAIAYGRIQNRLRIGNRSGLSIKLAPGIVPPEPFAPCYIKAAGFTGQFRVNACSWSMGPNGMVCGMDLLFWAGVGEDESGSVWFPVAPGVANLPETPAVTINGAPVPALSTAIPGGFNLTDPNLTTLFNTTLPTSGAAVFPKTMAPAVSVPAYNETIPHEGVIRLPAIAYMVPPATVFPVTAPLFAFGATDHSGALLHLHFDGVVGAQTFIDSSDYERSATILGSPKLALGAKFGTTCYKNTSLQVNTGLRYDDMPTLELEDFTIECWVSYKSKQGPGDEYYETTHQIISAINADNHSDQFELFIEDNSEAEDGSNMLLTFGINGRRLYAESSPLIAEQWYHVALVSKDGIRTLYVNGVADPMINTEEEYLGPMTWWIGSWWDHPYYLSTQPELNLLGSLDELVIWNYAKYDGDFPPPTRPYSFLKSSPALFGNSGSFATTGTAATLQRSLLVDAASGSASITGTNADLTLN